MPYSIRFFLRDRDPSDETALASVLTGIDPAYSLKMGLLRFGDEEVGELEVISGADLSFRTEIADFQERLREADDDDDRKLVERLLHQTRSIVLARLPDQGDRETQLARLDPLWSWLFQNRSGMMHAEGEGFYDGAEFAFEVE